MKQEEISLETLGKMTVLEDSDKPVVMASLWRDKPAVLVFVRHFG